jgi:subtilisin family serine protease
MYTIGNIVITLTPGEARPDVPNHLDCVLGACRRTGLLDSGRVDQVLRRYGGAFRAEAVYHARRSLGRVGEHHVGYDDLEERLGLSRTYQVELAEPDRTAAAVQALRDLACVEAAAHLALAAVPFVAPSTAPAARPNGSAARQAAIDQVWEPHRRVHAPEALELEPGDASVVVAIVDTGVSLGHPEGQRRFLAGYDTVDLGMGRVGQGLKLVGDSRGPDFNCADRVGHGSHVAGIIGAYGWRLPRGLAGKALMLPIRVLAAAAREDQRKLIGVGALPNIDTGLKVAVDLGADVINMSFGTAEGELEPGAPLPHVAIIHYAASYGCVLIAAAGNSGRLEKFYPAALPEVIAVTSVDHSGRRSAFSTYGSHCALAAPGEDIVSMGIQGYRMSSGTSHAAPFVSGAAALLVARGRRAGRELNGGQVRDLLVASAAPLGGGGFSPETGHGLLDAAAALRRLDATLASSRSNGRAS